MLSMSFKRVREIALYTVAATAVFAPCTSRADAQCTLSFAAGTSYPFAIGGTDIAAADLNTDGILDLVVPHGMSVYILIGNANGTFQAGVGYAAGGNTASVGIADFNNDTFPDVVLTRFFPYALVVLAGNGNGTIQAPSAPVGLTNADSGLAVGHFNADTNWDVAIAEGTGVNGVTVLLGNGSLGFGAPVSYPTGPNANKVAAGDLNADGRADLAVANFGPGNVSVLLANGAGGFNAAVNYATGPGAYDVAIGDLNGDTRPDLAVVNQGMFNGTTWINPGVSLLFNTGAGAFASAITHASPTGQLNNAVVIADLNRDGLPDIAAGNRGGIAASGITTLLNSVSGVFIAGPSFNGGNGPHEMVAADFNGDSRPDLATAPVNGGFGAVVLLNTTGFAITTHPARLLATQGSSASFSVAVSGATPTYQWRKDGIPLVNGGAISGATAAVLTINPTVAADNASAFDCLVTTACGSALSRPAALGVTAVPPGACCNGLTCTLVANAGVCASPRVYLGNGTACQPIGRNGPLNACCPADFNNTLTSSTQDLFDFLAAFFTPCQ